MKRTIVATVAAIVLLVVGCSSSDPAASEEYLALEQQLADTEQHLAEANQELTQAEAQVAAVTAQLDAEPAEATPAQEVALPTEAVAVLDGMKAAQAAYDTATMRQYLTDDFTFQSYGDVTDVDAYLQYIDAYYENLGFEVEVTGPLVVTGGDGTYIVAEPGQSTWTGNPGVRGFSITTLTEENGTWLSSQVRWIGEPMP